MVVTIEEVPTRSKAYKFYDVTIHHRVVKTVVTASPRVVDHWIKDHLQAPCRYQKIVGLDIEWRPSFTRGVQNPVATLQLCFHKCCLIFQIDRASSIPRSLYKALKNPSITYTGVKISGDAKKLLQDYALYISESEDIANLAANAFDSKEFRKSGLKTLVETIIGEEMDKPQHIRISNWDAKQLSSAQVKYACVDAYYSYKLGKMLLCGQSA